MMRRALPFLEARATIMQASEPVSGAGMQRGRRSAMRALVCFVTAVVLAGNAAAQSSPQDLDRLKRLLDEKLGSPAPKTRSVRPPDKPVNPDDFYVVQPDGTIRDPKVQGTQKRSAMGAEIASFASGLAGLAGSGANTGGSGAPVMLAQGSSPYRGAPQIQRDSYVVQLRSDLTSEELDQAIRTLREKYNLEITRSNNSLGILHVSPRGGTSRSVTAPRSLGAALEPPIIQDLRKEPFVDAAYVNFMVGPKAVPRRSDLKITAGQSTFAWHWRNGSVDDGNWGLKLMRMPPVWTILDRYRKANPDRPRARLVFLDVGFGVHGQITYNEVLGGVPTNPPFATCEQSHGTHVAGIAGALFGRGRGIDGMVPESKIDAIPVGIELYMVGADEGINPLNMRAILFTGAIDSLSEYLDTVPLKPGEKRVINVSLGYNWSTVGFEFGKDPEQDDNIKAHVISTARTVQRLATRLKDTALIVAAAGNDSEGRTPPALATWATPFGFAGTYDGPGFQKSRNVLVVEAVDRDGRRAGFSNVGGHVSAPGVNIVSTLAGVSDSYGACSGTSQASPHVAALAAILFELDPTKTPAEIADIIRSSAVQTSPDAAPRIDALAAVLKLSRDNLRYLVDLNGDGKVDAADLEIYKTHLAILADADINGSHIALDLNGDGNIDEDERCWPLIDFNGSGRASVGDADARPVGDAVRTDLQVIEAAWTDSDKPFQTAVAETGLDQLVAQWKRADATALVATTGQPKPPCH
jgi:subtilisin family serine protease